MTKYGDDELEERLGRLLGDDMPEAPAADVNVALRVAGLLEERGYAFRLKDLCPRSLSDCLWRASFVRGDETFAVEDADSAVAVCAAALAALEAGGPS